jgi:cell division protein FtsI/penicillin-binding protein 2
LNTAFILLPDFILILVGWGIRHYTPLRQSVWESLEQLVYWVLFPCLLFNSAINAKLVWADNMVMLLLLGFCMCAMGALAYSAKWLFNPDPVNLVSGIQTTFRFNTYIVLAVSARLLAPSGLELMAITIACLVPISNALSVISLAHRSGQGLLLELLKNPFVLATLSFGYGVSASAMQIAKSYLVFANHGRLPPRSLVHQDRSSVTAGEQVMSAKTADQLLVMLEDVVNGQGGTGRSAMVPGYRVAGKTGTARVAGVRGYQERRFMSSFVGIAPASNPRLIVAVFITEPSKGGYYGAQVAAPLFAKVMGSALRILDVAPDHVM